MHREDQEFFVRKIRDQYTEKENTPLDQLRALDAKVRRPALLFAWIIGILGALIMGSGMSLVMTEIGAVVGMENPMAPGIVLGIIGLVMACVNFPLYKKILRHRKQQYKAQIMQMSTRMLQE
ncbi:MAG: dihydropteridine reductase [Clostridiales bacterium]|nr:dihydropteridine reductase [Clostridiales bacterium]